MSESALILITTFLTSILGLFLAFVSFSFARLIKKYYQVKDEKKKLEESYKENADKIIADARANAQKIIADANYIKEEIRTEISGELSKTSAKQMEKYNQLHEKLQSQISEVLGQVANELKSSALGEIENFRSLLAQETAKSQGLLQASMRELHKEYEAQLVEYKNLQMQKIDQTILKIIKKVSKDFLGKALSTEEHQELILKSLELAKKENVFGDQLASSAESETEQDTLKIKEVGEDAK